MTEHLHQRARELAIDARVDEMPAADRQWLASHLADCDDCARFAASLDDAIAAIRLPEVMAGTSLVRATQNRVRARAMEIDAHRTAMRPLWIAVAMVGAWATVTTPLLWAAFAWVGAAFSLSNMEWRSGFFFAWIAPTLAASLMLLGSGSHRAHWRAVFAHNSETV